MFGGETKVLTPHGYKKIKDLNGDMVISLNGEHFNITISKTQSEVYSIGNLYVSKYHMLYLGTLNGDVEICVNDFLNLSPFEKNCYYKITPEKKYYKLDPFIYHGIQETFIINANCNNIIGDDIILSLKNKQNDFANMFGWNDDQ